MTIYEMDKRKIACEKTADSIIKAADLCGIHWPLEDPEITNKELYAMLFPDRVARKSKYAVPDFAIIHRKLAAKGFTLKRLWREYRDSKDSCYCGKKKYKYSMFRYLYQEWAEKKNAVMRLERKPGYEMMVDWAGLTVPYTDPTSGKKKKAYLFVATLPYSGLIYTCACADMTSKNWLQSHIKAYEYFGGATQLLIPDNLKTGVISHTKYEIELNLSYEELSKYYGTAVVPARVATPTDKAAVERSVGIVTEEIAPNFEGLEHLSLEEVNARLAKTLDEVNHRKLSGKDVSRFSIYEAEELEFMRPLPKVPYEVGTWKSLKVPRDYLVSDGKNRYSVPYTLIGERVDLRITERQVRIYYQDKLVAAHDRRSEETRNPIYIKEHMPPNHVAYLEKYNVESVKEWAEETGGCIKQMTLHMLASGDVPEQNLGLCVSLRNLVERNSVQMVEQAYGMAVAEGEAPTLRVLDKYVKQIKQQSETDPKSAPKKTPKSTPKRETLGFTRGSGYYE